MLLAQRESLKSSRSLVRAFGGLNEGWGCTEAEYSEGMNFSARDFPALSTRIPRRRLREAENVNGMYHLNGLLIVSGRDLLYTPDENGQTETLIEDAVSDDAKIMTGIGTKILIWPDKLAFDTAEGTLTPLETSWGSGEGDIQLTPCDAEGRVYAVDSVGTAEPENPREGQVFLKTGSSRESYGGDAVLEVYSEETGSWQAVSMEWCRMDAKGIGEGLREYDTVTIAGTLAKDAQMWEEPDGDCIVYEAHENWIRVQVTKAGRRFYGRLTRRGTGATWQSLDGTRQKTLSGAGEVTVKRRVPELDHMTECDNRVWGCSSRENVIYACKLGDPTNWFSYRGIAADSYAVTVGSDGAFTGAATCMGAVLFFKENTVHRLYGSKPSDFQLSALRCRGVSANAARSLCVLNETLYYLSPEGVMAWDGSLPTRVSTALDTARLSRVTRAVGGGLDGRYYLHIEREEGARLLVYDTERGLWNEEDDALRDMVSTGSQLYQWDGEALWATDPNREADWQNEDGTEENVRFVWVSGDMGIESPEEGYFSRLTVRLYAASPSVIDLGVSYDGGDWESVGAVTAQGGRRNVDLAFAPRRCASLRLRLRGMGQITLRSIARTTASAKGKLMKEEE